mgnify:CR=1 FL=1
MRERIGLILGQAAGIDLDRELGVARDAEAFTDGAGQRRTPAYDCKENRWVSLALGGDDPSGPQGRNVSLGLMYDQRRGQFWAVDAASRVYVLRLEPGLADLRQL